MAPVRLQGDAQARWRGEKAKRTPGGNVDRSAALFAIGCDLARAGASANTIQSALCERDHTLSWSKYAHRDDGDLRYGEIADKAVAAAEAGGQTTAAQNAVAQAHELLRGLVERAKADPGAAFE